MLSVSAGYNSIGVGAYYIDANGDKRMHDFSYRSSAFSNAVQNKPDMVVNSGSTSEAAPVLTGIVSLLLELKPELKNHPDIIKAILMASCHEKALPAVLKNGSYDTQESMFNGLTLKQGAGVVDAYQAICIALLGNYNTAIISSGCLDIDTIVPVNNDNINVSLVWLRQNYFTDINNSGYNDLNDGNCGNLQELQLGIYKDNLLISNSNRLRTGKQLTYFTAQENEDYIVRVIKTTQNTLSVPFAYAWSPAIIKDLSDLTITGKVAVGQNIKAEAYSSDGTSVPNENLNYQWYSSIDNINWNIIDNATSFAYNVTNDDLLHWLKCVAEPKDNTNIVPCSAIACTSHCVIKYGDVDLDEKISIRDSTAINMYCDNLTTLTDVQKRAADVNGDGYVTSEDGYLIQRFLIGEISVFPVERE